MVGRYAGTTTSSLSTAFRRASSSRMSIRSSGNCVDVRRCIFHKGWFGCGDQTEGLGSRCRKRDIWSSVLYTSSSCGSDILDHWWRAWEIGPDHCGFEAPTEEWR